MPHSRRRLLADGLSVAGFGLLSGRAPRAAEVRFTTDPFTLGVASGYPERTAVVLWTRLAPVPLAPDGGVPADVVAVDWELADDSRFNRIRRSGRSYATADWAHSVHVEVGGLEPARDYWYRFTSGGMQSPVGRTRTAPADGAARLRVALACCQHYESGHYAAYGAIAREDLDLVLHVGDYVYENRGVSRARRHDDAECYTLDDYRRRYAIYKSDPQLKSAHASFPWMVTWDDHEVDNDYAGATSEENDDEALFLARRAAAYQAYYEHMPLPRRMVPYGPYGRLHTVRGFGGLVDVYMLDGRQHRSDQACAGRLVSPCRALYDEQRSMLGAEQERWLDSSLGHGGARWTLLAQQTVFAHFDQQPGPQIGYWADGWNGYPAARQRLLDSLAARGIANPVVLSGDIHAFVVNDVHARPGDPESSVVAAELVTSSISSPGPPQAELDAVIGENPNVHLARSDVRGYTRLDIDRNGLEATLISVDDVARADSDVSVLRSFAIEAGRPGIAG